MSNIPHFWKSTVCKNFIFHLIDLNKQEETKQVFCCWIEAFRSCFDSLFLWINNRGQHIIVISYCFKNLFYFFCLLTFPCWLWIYLNQTALSKVRIIFLKQFKSINYQHQNNFFDHSVYVKILIKSYSTSEI